MNTEASAAPTPRRRASPQASITLAVIISARKSTTPVVPAAAHICASATPASHEWNVHDRPAAV